MAKTLYGETILEAVFDTWDADSALVAAVTGGRYTSIAPQGAAMPFVTFTTISGRVQHALQGGDVNTPHVEEHRVQFSVFSGATSPQQSEQIVDLIDTRYGVDGALTFDGSEYRRVSSRRENKIGPIWNADDAYQYGGYWQTNIDFIFMMERLF